MAFTEHASKKYVDERDALLATKNALAAEAEERARLANIVAQNRRDTYSKDEVNRIVEALRGARFVKVERLPELADADMLAIYLVPRTSPETDNRYDEYIVVTDGEGARSWDKLGSTDIDLSGYATKAEVQVVRESVGALSESVDELQESITSESSRISTLEDKVGNPSFVPTEDSNDLISSGGVFAALAGKADKETDERFMRTKADIYLSARKGNDANDGLAPERAVKTIGRAYTAAKAAVDAQTLDGTKQVVVAVDEGVYGSVQIINELTAGIAFRAVGARDSTFVVPSNDPGDGANQTPMSCDNGVYPHVFEMEGFTFTGFNGRHHTDMNPNSHQRGIVYGMTLRRCLITGNRPICTKAFVCGTFIDCEITGNATRPTPQNVGGDAPFGGYGAVYDDLAYMTRMFSCHVWDNDFSTFQYFAKKIEAAHCLFENSFAVAKGVADSYGGHNNTMIAERYTNPNFTYSDTRSKFYKIGVKYFAVIASPAGSTTDPFYTETADYVCVQSAQLTEDKIAADASCPSVRSDGSLDFGWRDSGLGLKKTADALTNGKQDALSAQQLANIAAVPDKANKSALPYEIKSVPIVSQLRLPASAFPVTWMATRYHGSGSIGQNDQYGISDVGTGTPWYLYNSDGDSIAAFDKATLAYLEPGYGVEGLSFSGNAPVVGASPVLEQVYSGTLYDRAVNKVALQAGTSAFSLTLPTQNDGRSRDFLLRIDNTATGAVDATATVVDATLVDAAGTAIASLAAPAGKATAYRLTEAANGTASPSANPVFIVAGANTDQQIARKLDAASAFPAFSAASTYTVGDVVTHEGGLYVCSTAVETAGPWDADDWTATSIAALLSRAVPMVVVDDEIEVAGLADTRRNGNDPDFATSWGNYVPLSWCYSYALNTSQGAYGIRLNSYTEPGNTANGVTLIAESSDGKPIYSAELVRTFAAPFDGEYDLEVTIRAPHNAINLPRYYDVLVDDETTPRLAYRPATSLSADEERVTRPGAIVLARGEHRLRIRALRHNNDNINMAVRGLKITTGN